MDGIDSKITINQNDDATASYFVSLPSAVFLTRWIFFFFRERRVFPHPSLSCSSTTMFLMSSSLVPSSKAFFWRSAISRRSRAAWISSGWKIPILCLVTPVKYQNFTIDRSVFALNKSGRIINRKNAPLKTCVARCSRGTTYSSSSSSVSSWWFSPPFQWFISCISTEYTYK